MPNKVLKFSLDDVDCVIEMPAGSQVLHVDNQRSDICVWVLGDTAAPYRPRRFLLLGTGLEVPSYCKYAGTLLRGNDDIVIHVFEHELVTDPTKV